MASNEEKEKKIEVFLPQVEKPISLKRKLHEMILEKELMAKKKELTQEEDDRVLIDKHITTFMDSITNDLVEYKTVTLYNNALINACRREKAYLLTEYGLFFAYEHGNHLLKRYALYKWTTPTTLEIIESHAYTNAL